MVGNEENVIGYSGSIDASGTNDIKNQMIFKHIQPSYAPGIQEPTFEDSS